MKIGDRVEHISDGRTGTVFALKLERYPGRYWIHWDMKEIEPTKFIELCWEKDLKIIPKEICEDCGRKVEEVFTDLKLCEECAGEYRNEL